MNLQAKPATLLRLCCMPCSVSWQATTARHGAAENAVSDASRGGGGDVATSTQNQALAARLFLYASHLSTDAVSNGTRLRTIWTISRHGGACPRRAMFNTRTCPNAPLTPPRSSPPWGDVSLETPLHADKPHGGEVDIKYGGLVVNTPPRRQAPRWEDARRVDRNPNVNPYPRTIRRGVGGELMKTSRSVT